MIWLAGYALAGALVGFLAGLLGIGGGMTLVPILAALLLAQGAAPDHIVHLALGTAMASILFTSGASVREHHRLGAVDWSVVRRMAPGMVAGTLASSFAAGYLPQRALAIAFALIVYAGATQILIGRKPDASRTLPGPLPLFGVGAVIGVISGLVSAGGSFLSMPFMAWCGVPVRTAIATAAALGLPVALVGTLGYIGAGWGIGGLPPYTIGFVVLPALAALVSTSIITAPMGARAAHRLPVPVLRRIFACSLYLLATKMIITYW
ncbi:MAG: sulfite exporter TauE/SafE family protein [Burkholderiales bacterium]|nr:sulfite exporter TauE/SafE family protein [Burkholderiales bacterium]